jgi:hypothetical protein
MMLLLSACGGGGGGGGSVPATSDSFSPITAVDASGNQVPLNWRYEINGGMPLDVDVEGETLQLTPGDLTVNLNPSDLVRRVDFDGRIGGQVEGISVSGQFDVSVTENVLLGTTTRFEDENLDLTLSLAGGGESVTARVSAMVDFSPPAEWFLDRTDLDTLGIGFVETTQISGTAQVTVDVFGERETDSIPFDTSETWTIVGQDDEITVDGQVYRNIVVVERDTVAAGSGLDGGLENVTINYWLAKGIGIVRSTGEFSLFGDPLVIELTETNLTQDPLTP